MHTRKRDSSSSSFIKEKRLQDLNILTFHCKSYNVLLTQMCDKHIKKCDINIVVRLPQ